MPLDLPVSRESLMQARASGGAVETRGILDVANNGTGAVPTILTPDFIQLLRARICTIGLGATIFPDMRGNFSIPKQTGAATASWLSGENTAPSGTYQTIGQVQFTPKFVSAFTDISKDFIWNSIIPAEEFVRNDFSRIIAIALETAAITGAGSGGVPLGVITNLTSNYTGQIRTLSNDSGNGGAPTFGDMVALETLVANQNADMGKLAYLTNPKVRGTLKQTARYTGSGTVQTGFVWEDEEVNGYPAAVTTLVPSNGTKGTGSNLSTILYGDWTSLVYVLWGALDIVVDPYSQASLGNVRCVVRQTADINVRHGESFAMAQAIATS